MRNLDFLPLAYVAKLWWSYNTTQSLWSSFMHSKYEGRLGLPPQITDTPCWKRICAVHSLCISHIDGLQGSHVWKHDNRGVFTLKSAYAVTRPAGVKLFSHSFIWHRLQIPSVGLFMWKLYHGALPLQDNFRRLRFMDPHVVLSVMLLWPLCSIFLLILYLYERYGHSTLQLLMAQSLFS